MEPNGNDGLYKFKILSLDGGGIRGAFTAAYLADVEKRLSCRIAEHFDIIAGTSTGAIIAAALALGEPAARIEQFYREHGPLIFRRWWERPTKWYWCPARWFRRALFWPINNLVLRWMGVDHSWLWRAKYDNKELKGALEDVFAGRTVGDVKTCRLLIPTVDLTQGQTWLFKTPHMEGLFRDKTYRIADVLMATTAAPTYFPHAVVGKGSAFVDGGVWANNPSMVAVAEAARISNECRRDGIDPIFDLNSVYLLSIGTGKFPYFANPPARGAGIFWWAQKLINLVMNAQAQGVHFQTSYILRDRYHRVDYPLPNGTWSLDCVAVIDQLIHMGKAKSPETIAALQPMFFTTKARPYQPYPGLASASGAGVT